jgi:hypothetical protein
VAAPEPGAPKGTRRARTGLRSGGVVGCRLPSAALAAVLAAVHELTDGRVWFDLGGAVAKPV